MQEYGYKIIQCGGVPIKELIETKIWKNQDRDNTNNENKQRQVNGDILLSTIIISQLLSFPLLHIIILKTTCTQNLEKNNIIESCTYSSLGSRGNPI